VKRLWLNDKNAGTCALLTAVMHFPDRLVQAVEQLTPSVQLFYEIQEEVKDISSVPTTEAQIIDLAAKKILLHQCSYQGMAEIGGALGRKDQTSPHHDILSQWKLPRLRRKIHQAHGLFARTTIHENECTNYDYSVLLKDTTEDTVIYVDPPYYGAPHKLYWLTFNNQDHRNLAHTLQDCPARWVTSYNKHPFIERLYGWAKIDAFKTHYKIRRSADPATLEPRWQLVVTPK
jgi:DNA adenine methylase